MNFSEGRRRDLVEAVVDPARDALLDLHVDPWHNRSVATLAGDRVVEAAIGLARAAVERLDLRGHTGAHPRIGVVDVVPFVPLGTGDGRAEPSLTEALAARARFARFAADELGVPCFYYGPERSLPDIRRDAFAGLCPDVGPPEPHERAGACCVGARRVLVAYNCWLNGDDVALARRIAREIRGPEVRALGLEIGGRAQVSCNLVAPLRVGPAEVFDAVAAIAPVGRTELVGLVPEAVLEPIDPVRHEELDLDETRTIEYRLARLRYRAPS